MDNPQIHHSMPRRYDARSSHTLSSRALGLSVLALIFIAGVALVWAYMVDATARPDARAAAALAAASTSPATSTIISATTTATSASSSSSVSFSTVHLIAQAAIVVDLTTGKTLFARNADAQLPLASLTKVPMAFVVSQALPASTNITIPYDTAPSGSAERLTKGSVWHLQDVIDFTLIASSNEGAVILASAANDSVRAAYPEAPEHDATVWRMNALAQSLGLAHTYFLNPSGLDESTTQAGAFGSARDMAALFAYVASTSPRTFAGTTEAGTTFTSIDGHKTVAYNTNQALSAIPGIVMGKTGYTDLAGGNLAVVFDEGHGHRVVAVVMHSTEPGRFADMKALVAATVATLSASQ